MGTKNRILYLKFKYRIQTYKKMLMTILSLVLEPMLVNIYWIINKILFLGLVPQPWIKTLDHYWNYWNYENGLMLNILMTVSITTHTIIMNISFIIETAE